MTALYLLLLLLPMLPFDTSVSSKAFDFVLVCVLCVRFLPYIFCIVFFFRPSILLVGVCVVLSP